MCLRRPVAFERGGSPLYVDGGEGITDCRLFTDSRYLLAVDDVRDPRVVQADLLRNLPKREARGLGVGECFTPRGFDGLGVLVVLRLGSSNRLPRFLFSIRGHAPRLLLSDRPASARSVCDDFPRHQHDAMATVKERTPRSRLTCLKPEHRCSPAPARAASSRQ